MRGVENVQVPFFVGRLGMSEACHMCRLTGWCGLERGDLSVETNKQYTAIKAKVQTWSLANRFNYGQLIGTSWSSSDDCLVLVCVLYSHRKLI